MIRMRTLIMAFVAVLAMSAVAAASASAALPEFSKTKVKVTGKSGAGTLETVTGTKVTCTGGTSSGEITAEKTVSKTLVIFTGCASSGFKCSTSGAASGELKTKELTGTLGYLTKSTKEVGLDLKPASGTEFIEFECAGGIVKVKVTGSVICPLTPVNTSTTTFTLTCKQKAGVQEFKKFEGGEEDVLKTSKNGGAAEGSGEETTTTLTASEAAEIKA